MIKFPARAPMPHELFRGWAWVLPLTGLGDYRLCTDGCYRHVFFPMQRVIHPRRRKHVLVGGSKAL